MSSDRGGLLKSRAESFARHLQTRLRTLSESQAQDDAWSESGDSEIYYDIQSPLASPEEEAVEPVFITAQNIDNLGGLQRTDSETSTYYDTLESVEELKTLSPVGLFNTENRIKTTIENGFVDLLDNNTSIDNFELSSILKLNNESVIGNNNGFCDAGSSGIFDSLRSQFEIGEEKTDSICDLCPQEQNNNIGKYLEEVTDFVLSLESNNCHVVEVDTRQSEDTSAIETSADIGCKDVYCVFCDIEQIKTGLTSDCIEDCEVSRKPSESEINSPQLHGFLGEATPVPSTETSEEHTNRNRTDHKGEQGINRQDIPQIVVGNNTNNYLNSDENSSLLNVLRELKIEITEENLSDKSKTEANHSTQLEDLGLTSEELCTVSKAKVKGNEVDEFDLETKRKHFQRSSSLKSGKTPPGTPGRKKIVRFADVLGLDLADVKTFLDEVPTVPKSAYKDLHDVDLTTDLVTQCLSKNTITVVIPQVEKVLTPLFQQPCMQPNFLDRVRQHNVCLENAIVSDMSLFAISGLVRVKNMDFHKSVHVRYTINGWHSFSDLQARYVPNSCDGFSDKFSFTLYAHTLSVGQRIEFAVRFQTSGTQFWDNNSGLNYVFVCNSLHPVSSSSPSLPVSCDDVTAAFY